ncbi:U-box domain-containing protein 28-like [Primulina eburnea]|uniref:U-box domain-containing protein 28-like n=1 Tax=Primulina eburnea TaxID=1245227 RepID=UPI003C6C1CF4
MVKDDLHTTVPTYFRCPISLEVMEFPVSLCTGVTYDRGSIQRWLDAGNNTCPATMQQLHTKELVPNHTLRRLIKIWSESVPTRPVKSAPSPQSLSRDQAEQIILQLEIDLKMIHSTPFPPFYTIGHNLSVLISFVNEGCDNRKVVTDAGGRLLPLLVSLIGKKQSLSDLCLLEKIVLFCNVIFKNRVKTDSELGIDNAKFPGIEMGMYDYKTIILTCLKQGRFELRIAAVEFLELMVKHLGSQMQQSSLIPEDDEMYFELLRLIVSSNRNSNALEASLNLLSRMVVFKKNRSKMVRVGGVKALTKALSEPELSPPLTEKVLKLLEIASSCREGRDEICGNELCVQAILKKVLKVSDAATELAVTLLWSLCCFSGDKRVAALVAESSGVAKILLLMQSNFSPNVRHMCGDLLKMLRFNSKGSCLSCYDTKTCHIMPF